MNIVFLGPPGVGKGTQAKRIAQEYNLAHIATGDILRAAVSKDTVLGRKVKEIMSRGDLVPDEIVFSLVRERLASADFQEGFLLDGFPRNISQAVALGNYLKEKKKKIDYVVYFEVTEEEIIRRLSARRICSSCQANYNLITQPPKKEGLCDFCGSKLILRRDDYPEIIRERLRVYQKETTPLVKCYQTEGLLKKINGNGKIEEIYQGLKEIFSAPRKMKSTGREKLCPELN